MNDEYLENIIDQLKATEYLLKGIGYTATYGDDISHLKEALFSLSENMNSIIKNLENNIDTKEK